MLGVILATALLAPGDLGFLFRHHQPAPSSSECCDDCGVETARVADLICRLQTAPRWRDRDNAARALRRVNWKCHPEAPLALAGAMLSDGHEEVREEAAESLSKMKPCLPEVHAALERAANCDPDHATRKWARRGLSGLGKECIDACSICGNAPPPETLLPGDSVLIEPPVYAEPPLVLPPGNAVPLPTTPPPAEVLPPSEMPPFPGASSPFGEIRSARPAAPVPALTRVRLRAG